MPGAVANAAPTTVFPSILYAAITQQRAVPLNANEYRDGASQRARLAETSRKRFEITTKLSFSQLATLRSFFDARKGPHEPFYFYFGWETSPLFSHDPTGVATTGRYTVRLETSWEQMVGKARGEVHLVMVELA